MFVDQGEPTPDGSRFYGREVSYERKADGRYHVRAFTLDPWTYPTDGRVIRSATPAYETTHVRELGGRRYLLQQQWGASLRILRMQGEIAVPAAFLSGDPANDYIQVEGMARENRPSGFAGDVHPQDFFMDANGDVWRTGKNTKIIRYRLQGFTAQGNPIYHYANADVWGFPAEFSQIRQIEYVGGALYISGYGPGEAPPATEFDEWMWSGKRIARYNALPTGGAWPAPAWNKPIHYGLTPPPPTGVDRPLAFATNGTLIAVGYQREPGANSGYLRLYSAANGSETRVIRNSDFPSQFGERGWLDMHRALTFVGDWVWMEENQLSKQVGIRVS